MTYTKHFLLLFISATLLVACSSEEGSGTADTAAEKADDASWKTSEQMSEQNSSDATLADNDELSLNDGEKWAVNEEMKPHIQQGEQMLQDFQQKGKSNYDELAQALQSKNTALIQSCTMKGRSHDELHKWLEPHLLLTKKLAAAENPDQAKEVVNELQASFATYNEYFE